MKLPKNFVHFEYNLRVNKKNILGEYSSFFKLMTWNYLHLDWITLYGNYLYPAKRPVTGGPVKSTKCETIIILTRKESFFFGWEGKVH